MITSRNKTGRSDGDIMRLSRGAMIALALFLPVASGPGLLRWASAEKPQAPIALTLEQRPLSDGRVQMILTARPRLSADAVTLSLRLPATVTPVDDAAGRWSGPLAKDETKQVTIVVRGPDDAIKQVVGRAEVNAPSIGTFIQEVQGARRADLPLADPPSDPIPATTHDGDDPILEYSGE